MGARQIFQGFSIISPADLKRLPGYVDDFDPTSDPIESIEYHYHFATVFRCSNARCHQQHSDGFLVRLKSDMLTNVGWVCASKADAGFGEKVNKFFEERHAPWLREQILTFKSAAAAYETRMRQLEAAAWTLIKKKRVLHKLFPSLFEYLTKSQYSDIMRVTKVVYEERTVTDQYGKEKQERRPTEHVVGEIHGLSFLRDHLGSLITDLIRPTLNELEAAAVGTMSHVQLSKCYAKCQHIDAHIARAGSLVEAGMRLFSADSERAIRAVAGTRELEAECRGFSLDRLDSEPEKGSVMPKKLSRRERRARCR